MDQSTEMGHLLLFRRKPEAVGDVAGIDSYRCRVTGRVPIPRIESGYQGGSERQIRPFKVPVCLS